MSKYTYEKLYLLKDVFINLFRDHKLNDAAKEIRYAEHYYKYSYKNLGQTIKNCLNGFNIKKFQKLPTNNDVIIAYASRYKAHLNYLSIIYR
jgi:hypothetical protein